MTFRGLLGGLFRNIFTTVVNSNVELTFDKVASQHISAYMLAFDQINDKFDGIYDEIFPDTLLYTSVDTGQLTDARIPPNIYMDGANGAYYAYYYRSYYIRYYGMEKLKVIAIMSLYWL